MSSDPLDQIKPRFPVFGPPEPPPQPPHDPWPDLVDVVAKSIRHARNGRSTVVTDTDRLYATIVVGALGDAARSGLLHQWADYEQQRSAR